MGATARLRSLIAEKHAIFERGLGPKRPVDIPDENGVFVTKMFAAEPGPGDKKRARAIDKEFIELDEPTSTASVTLPVQTEIEIERISALPDFQTGIVKFNVIKTSHPGLRMKKEGGGLSNGKRIFLVRGISFGTAAYHIVSSPEKNDVEVS
ncbi:hypothetical protein ACWKW9_17000 [Rhizobium daejeonense]